MPLLPATALDRAFTVDTVEPGSAPTPPSDFPPASPGRDLQSDPPPDSHQAAEKGRLHYVLCTRGRQPVEIDIHNYHDPFDDVFLTYYVRAFRHLEETTSVRGFTVYFIWDSKIIPELPSYGDDVIVLLLQDEAATIPHYMHRIRFAFKAYGFRPSIRSALNNVNFTSLLKGGKDILTWSRHSAAFLLRNGLPRAPHNAEVVPLGYARQTDVPMRPFESRRYLVSFVGSLENRTRKPSRLRSLFGDPKSIARSDMMTALRHLGEWTPDRVWYSTTGSFRESIHTDGVAYSEIMADTKICLAPRGSSLETYRFFEGLRQGCIVICDRLPPHWFYDGCPAIQVRNWRNLESIVSALVANPHQMAALHRASVEWWETKCSEQALARVFARCLQDDARLALTHRAAKSDTGLAAA